MSTRPKILIVDDNEINLIVLKKVLEVIDATLVEATSGNEALAATLDNDFALAILDVKMPGMDGYELAGLMRGNSKTKNVPIMFLTAAYDDEFHMFRGYEAGGVDYLTKPYEPEVLLAKIRVFLELDHDRRELERHRNQLEEMVADRVSDIAHMNKVLKLMRELDQLIVHEKSSAMLIGSACEILARVESFGTTWIILKNESTGETQYAQVGIEAEVFDKFLDGFQRNGIPGCCKFIQAHQDIVVASQFNSECVGCSLLEVCHHGDAMISQLSHQEQHYGWIFVSLPDAPTIDEQANELFRQIANDLGYALHGISTRRERDKAARELRKTNRKLVRRSEEIQYFYHSLAHELKTPLTAAQEFLSFVTEGLVGDLNEIQAQYLGFVQESCANLVTYTNDLLDMTRLDTGKLSLNPEPAKLQNLIPRILDMARNEAAKKNIQLRSELEPGIESVDIDKSRITQVLFNLLTNAMKFTPVNGLVEVKLYKDPQISGRVCISVTDTGCGIPEDQLPYIFRRYYQVDPANLEPGDGFGLGLYLCKEIVKLHGGEISVKSMPGKGSTFKLSLPLVQKPIKSTDKKQKAYIFKNKNFVAETRLDSTIGN